MKKTVFAKISTMPSPKALKWAGKERSILSSILLWSLWLCRVLSLLQICKFIYRKIVILIQKAFMEKDSVRPNVPPMFCEIYFIAWFVWLLTAYLTGLSGAFVQISACYFLSESMVWVLYYTIFRRFFEDNYSIYHELEYLTVLILLVPTQALGFGLVYKQNFQDMLTALLGAGGDTTPFLVQLAGSLFAAIVISMIISTFPLEAIKKQETKTARTLVLGNGQVVTGRILPALRKKGFENIRIYDIGQKCTSADKSVTYLPTTEDICEEVQNHINERTSVWIATPSHTHMPYFRACTAGKAPLVVVEKPITCKAEELTELGRLLKEDGVRERTFFLSYYILEKALPLYYLVSGREAYGKYVTVNDRTALYDWRSRLGVLRTARVHILEGEDTRIWAFQKENGGQKLETFLHNVLLATLFCGLPQSWEKVDYQDREEDGVYKISLTACSGSAEIDLRLCKNLPQKEKRRFCEYIFDGGHIYVDLEEQTMTLYFADIQKSVRMVLKEDYQGKYTILTDLVSRVQQGECTTAEVDGLENQMETIHWLLNL